MTSLKQFIASQYGARRPSRPRTARRPMREDFGDVSVTRSPGVDLEDRAARMNEFWKALVEFHDRDVLVIARYVGDKSKRAVPRLSAITPIATELLRCGERSFVPLGAIGIL